MSSDYITDEQVVKRAKAAGLVIEKLKSITRGQAFGGAFLLQKKNCLVFACYIFVQQILVASHPII